MYPLFLLLPLMTIGQLADHYCHCCFELSFSRISESTTGYTFISCVVDHVQLDEAVGFLISKLFNVNLQTSPDYATFESICVNIYNSCFCGFFICIYRPPVHQLTSFKNCRIFWKMSQPCTHHFTLLAILIFTWIHHLQQLPRLMISWHHLTQNNMSISQQTYMAIGSTS